MDVQVITVQNVKENSFSLLFGKNFAINNLKQLILFDKLLNRYHNCGKSTEEFLFVNIKKSVFFSLFSTAILIILLPIHILACACCADEGYYRISVQKPDDFMLGELKKLKFSDSKLYADASFPENIKGLNSPSDGNYKVSGSIGGDSWQFNFTDANGNKGTLNLKNPKQMVNYAVDTHRKDKGGAGSVILYKELRFKYKVDDGTGIFADGIKGKTEYFLVLQGEGNACTTADDFKNWRLEVTGKRANYAFYGSLKGDTENTAVNSNNSNKQIPISTNSKKKDFVVANLKGKNYYGCGCSGVKFEDIKKGNRTLFFWSEWKQNPKGETVIFNINGKDTEFKLVKKGKRPEKEKVGDRFEDEYEANGLRVILDYETTKLPCEECEGTDYKVTTTIIGEFEGKVIALSGSCGC